MQALVNLIEEFLFAVSQGIESLKEEQSLFFASHLSFKSWL